ncbi:MAG TPA: glycoside hydrolase family 2 TIM barrel-domain containing protein [Nocardioides sp.]|nr:glycoside hydrolase family 2 TIM barrel-domain containing protein [Nocardioides sp.]
MPAHLLTRWGRVLDPDRVLPEYPRPQLVRESYLNLNGRWEIAFRPLGDPEPREYDGQVLVPFSPEAPLSGVGRQLQPDEHLWYRRTVHLPRGFHDGTGRVLLHFGAVDQSCSVWCNGVQVGGNDGGYLPFACDVTAALHDGDEGDVLVVRVRDVSNNQGPSSGKQRLRHGGIWYTAQSGIWQTVWMERVPPVSVDRLDLVPLLDVGAVEVTVHAAGPGGGAVGSSGGPAHVRVLAGGGEVGAAEVTPGRPTTIPLAAVHPWTPDDPFLHDVEVTLGEDRVTSYVGMRSVAVAPDAEGHPRLLVNGEPFPHLGVLDQGWWSDGLMTAPSDEALVHDIATMKRLGFTLLRKHVKVEPLRWYHHCDRLGMLVWQDLPNGGGRYRTAAVSWPGRRGYPSLPLRDDRPWSRALLGRADAAWRAAFREELHRTVALLRNVPSLTAWVPFNEGWGQFDAAAIARELGELDPTRLVDHASGWHDQGAGDLWSPHVYMRRFRVPRRRRGDRRALALSEYGGYDLHVAGHTSGDPDFGYRHFDSAVELGAAFARLHADLAEEVPRGLAATVYTQLSDVEGELNGLLTFDREVLKLPEDAVRGALAPLREALSRGRRGGG